MQGWQRSYGPVQLKLKMEAGQSSVIKVVTQIALGMKVNVRNGRKHKALECKHEWHTAGRYEASSANTKTSTCVQSLVIKCRLAPPTGICTLIPT